MRLAALLGPALLACSAATTTSPAGLPAPDDSCAGPCPQSKIKHVVVVIQENHTFDDHFGRYCTAPADSQPTCTAGRDCCEAAPDKDASGHTPVVLTDDAQALHDPDHTQACEALETNGGAMDRYAMEPACGGPENVAVGDQETMQPYWDLAKSGALADRYFQPEVGQSSANDLYFARASHVFTDNAAEPKGAVGTPCSLQSANVLEVTDPSLGDLLDAAGVPWTFYAEGYDAQATAQKAGKCAERTDSCPANVNFSPCTFEPGDVPFEYFSSSRDDARKMRDLSAFTADLAGGTLPAVSFVKGLGYHTEHPGARTRITDGEAFVAGLWRAVSTSRYRQDTLFLLTFDEGGGYWDHVRPPVSYDLNAYGTRVPTLALGPFAKRDYVSHVTMEHSSVVAFVEWNFLGKSGQLGTRDRLVHGLGSLIDASAAGAAVPE